MMMNQDGGDPPPFYRRCYMNVLLGFVILVVVFGIYKMLYTDLRKPFQLNMKQLENDIDSLRNEIKWAMKDVRREIEEQFCMIERNVREGVIKSYLNEHQSHMLANISKMISKAIELYDADKTGLADFALGGSIVSIDSNSLKQESIFGATAVTHSARCLIEPHVIPGACWAFEGSKASVLIQLTSPVYVTGVSLEHIPKSISPTGQIKSAPKEFSIWGYPCCDTAKGKELGLFVYNANGSPIQYFNVEERSRFLVHLLELRILSNHGESRYTCVYRLRVHGTLSKPSSCIQLE